MLSIPSCAFLVTFGKGAAVGAAAAAGAAISPVTAFIAAILAYFGIELTDEENKVFPDPPDSNLWDFLSESWPYALIVILIFTPSGQYILRKLRERISQSKTPKP